MMKVSDVVQTSDRIGAKVRELSWVPCFLWRIGHSITRCCGSSGTCDCCW